MTMMTIKKTDDDLILIILKISQTHHYLLTFLGDILRDNLVCSLLIPTTL